MDLDLPFGVHMVGGLRFYAYGQYTVETWIEAWRSSCSGQQPLLDIFQVSSCNELLHRSHSGHGRAHALTWKTSTRKAAEDRRQLSDLLF